MGHGIYFLHVVSASKAEELRTEAGNCGSCLSGINNHNVGSLSRTYGSEGEKRRLKQLACWVTTALYVGLTHEKDDVSLLKAIFSLLSYTRIVKTPTMCVLRCREW
jgi:hypothetical protein